MGRSPLLLLLPLLMVSVASGCSTFHRDYAAATAKPPEGGAIGGAWRGTWQSAGGHRGALYCVLTPTARPAADGTDAYRAQFEAHFWKVFTAHYDVVLTGSRDGDATHLTGDHDLGFYAGGRYHYDARVTPGKFDATYTSKYDHGDFHMTRP